MQNTQKHTNHTIGLKILEIIFYIFGIVATPFFAYGVSQTLAECFPKIAVWVRLSAGFKFSPIFLILISLVIIYAIHTFAKGVAIKFLKNSSEQKEANKLLLISLLIFIICLIINILYFVSVMGNDVMGWILSSIPAFVNAIIPLICGLIAGFAKGAQLNSLEKEDKEE